MTAKPSAGASAASPASPSTARLAFDVAAVRRQFPILQQTVHGKSLVYLDNAATSQKPQAVIDAVSRYYAEHNSNVHRGVHHLSDVATKAYEGSRDKVQRFLNARHREEIVFTRGTTEAINLAANAVVRPRLRAGDEIVVSHMEHHSNIVPWQLTCEATGATLRVIPITDAGELDLAAFERLLGPKTKLVAIGHVSNALGTVNPVKRIVAQARIKAPKALVLVDGAQAVPHMAVDLQDLGCDLYAFSAHKMYGPTGIGVLYGRKEVLDHAVPWQGGGDMIRSVTFEKTTYNDLPYRLEAGTPNIAGAIGLGVAIDWLVGIGLDNVQRHEHDLLAYATKRIAEVPGVKVLGTAREKAGVLSFVVEGVHPHDVGSLLDRDGVAVRTGHHCAQPVMDRYGVPATSRASFAAYNTRDDVDAFIESLKRVVELFR